MKDSGDIRGLAEVSDAYGRAGFDDLPPEAVDKAVRSAAARATRRRLLAARLPTWAAPIAIAATVIIGVATLLSINDIAIVTDEPAQAPSSNRTTNANEPPTDATGRTGRVSTKPVVTDAASPVAACGETATADPDVWLECITGLRKQGSFEQAAREIERLRARFPRFDLPRELGEPSR